MYACEPDSRCTCFRRQLEDNYKELGRQEQVVAVELISSDMVVGITSAIVLSIVHPQTGGKGSKERRVARVRFFKRKSEVFCCEGHDRQGQ